MQLFSNSSLIFFTKRSRQQLPNASLQLVITVIIIIINIIIINLIIIIINIIIINIIIINLIIIIIIIIIVIIIIIIIIITIITRTGMHQVEVSALPLFILFLVVSRCFAHASRHARNKDRALERMGGETSQLALARCVMRGVLGRERSRGRTVEKWRVKTKFCRTYKVHCYG